MDIGATLRSARERRRLSLDQLSRVTKISTTALGALEHNELHKLPPPIFARGFVRAYAREVGLDVEEMVREFSAQLEPHPDDVGGADQGERIDASDRVGDVEGQDQWHRGVLVRLLSLSLVLAVVGVLFGAYRGSPTSPGGGEAVAQSSRGGRATPADPPPSAAGTTGVQEAPDGRRAPRGAPYHRGGARVVLDVGDRGRYDRGPDADGKGRTALVRRARRGRDARRQPCRVHLSHQRSTRSIPRRRSRGDHRSDHSRQLSRVRRAGAPLMLRSGSSRALILGSVRLEPDLDRQLRRNHLSMTTCRVNHGERSSARPSVETVGRSDDGVRAGGRCAARSDTS